MEFIALAGAFLFMPYVFIAVCLALCLTIALCIDNSGDHGDGWGWATVASAALVYLLSTYFGITIADIKAAPSSILLGLAGYVVVGTVWSFAKWYFKLAGIRDTYIELKAKFIESNRLKENFLKTPIAYTDSLTKEEDQARDEQIGINEKYARYIDSRMKNYGNVAYTDARFDPTLIVNKMVKPLASKHKSSITQWIAFWPVSLTWTLINDPVRKVANYIFNKIKGTFQRISDAMFAGI